jgi:hypothetical protein
MPESTLLEPLERFVEASNKLAKAQYQARGAAAKRTAEAYRRYLESISSLQQETQRRWQDTGASLSDGQQEDAQESDPQARYSNLYATYVRAAQNIQEDYETRFSEVHQNYLTELEVAQKDSETQFLEAYREYLRTKQEAWAQLDINAIVNAAAITRYQNYV